MTGFYSTGSTFLNKGLSTVLAKGLLTTGAGLASKIDFFSSTYASFGSSYYVG